MVIEKRRIGYQEGYLRGIRVFHRGKEVTNLCSWVDPLAGAAELYVTNEHGHKALTASGTLEREIVNGVAIREAGPHLADLPF